MDDIQFFSEDIDEPTRHVVTLDITANAPSLVGPLLDALESLLGNTPGVFVDMEAPGFTRTFYGYEYDVWSGDQK